MMKPALRATAADAVYCLLLALLALSLFAFAKAQVLPLLQGPVTFDGKYYLSIAEDGYAFNGDIEDKQNIAYMPLTAGEIGMAQALVPGGNEMLEVALAGALVLFGTLLGLVVLAGSFADRQAGWIVALLWAASPMAFYNFVGYSEPIFGLLCVWTFVFLGRGALWPAAALAALAMLGRPQAVVLVAFVAFAVMARARWRPGALLDGPGVLQLALLAAPLMAFATWQALAFGDSLAYVNALEAWRRGSFLDGSLTAIPAFLYFFDAVTTEASSLSHWTTLVAGLSLATIAGTLALSSATPWRFAAFYVALLGFLFASASFDATNIARHTFFMFPWALVLGVAIARMPARLPVKLLALFPGIFLAAAVNFEAVMRYYQGQWVS